MGVLVVALAACSAVLTPPPLPSPTPEPLTAVTRGLATPISQIQLTPIPPTPTFTPSPTPTPVVHIVQQGDTLLGIALEYGITLNALVNANGLDTGQFLRIGQSLIIPLDVEEEQVSSVAPMDIMLLPTPTPLPQMISGVALYQTPADGLWCLGEVINTTEGPTTNLQVEVALVTGDGMRLMTVNTLAAADYLPPQGRAPFSVLFRDPPAGVADVAVQVLRAEPIGPITAGFTPLDPVETSGAVSGPQYRVAGTVVNSSDRAVRRVSVVATVYGAEGEVLGYRQQIAEDASLAPGEGMDFAILITPQNSITPSAYSVVAWAVAQ